MVINAIDAKTLSLKLNYRTGNIIGFLVHRVFSASSQLLQSVGREPLMTQILPCLCYNATTGCYEQLPREDWFSLLSQRESLTPYVRLISIVACVYAIAAGQNW